MAFQDPKNSDHHRKVTPTPAVSYIRLASPYIHTQKKVWIYTSVLH